MTTATETTAVLQTLAGWGAWVRISVAATPAAEEAFLAFYRRACPPYTGGSDYNVVTFEDVADEAGEALLDLAFPTCEHGMNAHLCAGPDHFLSYEQERALWG